MRGSLPWQGVKVQDKKEKYEMIKQRKLKTPLSELCKGMPSEFCEFVETIR
jgi:hypothetical protein